MAKLTKTKTPGIFRRHRTGCDGAGRCGCSYVIVWRHRGKQYKETHRTLPLARAAKREHEADVARGEFSEASDDTLHKYAREWIERYQGTGRRGFRQETRDDYRATLERYALRYFPSGLKLAEISPRMVADFIGWLVEQKAQGGSQLSDASVRAAVRPLSVCLATARREGLIRHNPARDAVLPHRPQAEEDEERPRPFPGETMELVVSIVHVDHRLMFELLAATGLRRSELLALQGRDLRLRGERPEVRVRRRLRRQRGNGLVIGPLKSGYARRELPIPLEIADRLAALKTASDDLVFTTRTGTPLDPKNLYNRVLRPACAEAGVEWAGFHTFRHTVASRLFDDGRNPKQVQRWLGHHSPSFTIDTYVHLLDEGLGGPLGSRQGNTRATDGLQTPVESEAAELLETA